RCEHALLDGFDDADDELVERHGQAFRQFADLGRVEKLQRARGDRASRYRLRRAKAERAARRFGQRHPTRRRARRTRSRLVHLSLPVALPTPGPRGADATSELLWSALGI